MHFITFLITCDCLLLFVCGEILRTCLGIMLSGNYLLESSFVVCHLVIIVLIALITNDLYVHFRFLLGLNDSIYLILITWTRNLELVCEWLIGNLLPNLFCLKVLLANFICNRCFFCYYDIIWTIHLFWNKNLFFLWVSLYSKDSLTFLFIMWWGLIIL